MKWCQMHASVAAHVGQYVTDFGTRNGFKKKKIKKQRPFEFNLLVGASLKGYTALK